MSKTPITDLSRKAAQQGIATSRFRVTPDEAKRIREAEAAGGHQAGLALVLQILRAKTRR